jgi:MSHA pilin protein MshA
MKNQQSGFTLIELIMVIVILGILAAFALPRFADLGANARAASINGLAGSLKSAAAIARSTQIARGDTLGVSVVLDGTTVLMVNGYPQAIAGGISTAVGVIAGTDYTATAGGAGGAAVITYQIVGTALATCQVQYTSANAAVANTAPITAPPVITVDVSAC